jgi:PTS system mannose-specific IIA component
MVKILVVTHGNLAVEFINVAKKVTEQSIDAVPICLDLTSSQPSPSEKIRETLTSLKNDQSAIILTDLFGGTPSNITIPFIQKDKVEVITGINLSMILYIISRQKEKSFKELCEGAKKAGEEGIIIAGEFLS